MDSPSGSNSSFSDRSYALSGKIMLSAIVVLFFVVVLMICLHLYARWYLLRARRRQMRRRSRRQNLVFYVDPATTTNPTGVPQSRGLDAAVLKSLPVFVYSSADSAESAADECAVCLSEFEEKEVGRTLPKCAHSFHTECIDMWFHSHSTCPLCRSPVEPPPPAVESVEPCDSVEIGPSTSSGGGGGERKSRGELGIEVPRRNFGEESSSEAVAESPASQGFRSPMSRMLSFTRILSRDWRANNGGYVLSPRTPIPTSCGGSATVGEEMVVEVDLERGAAEETRPGPSS